MKVPAIIMYLVITLWCSVSYLSPPSAEGGERPERATVKSDSLEVHSRAARGSSVMKSLKRGDMVSVEIEVEGSDGTWCAVVEEGQTVVSGYVLCQWLERETNQKKSWKKIGTSAGKEKNAGKPAPAGKVSSSPKRAYSEVEVILYTTSW